MSRVRLQGVPKPLRSLLAANRRTVEVPRVARASSSKTVPFPANEISEARIRDAAASVKPGTHMSYMNSWLDPDDEHNLRIETIKREDIAWVILQGEADIATLRDLEAALEHVELDGVKSVHLHVSELDFADAATIRRLTAFAKQAKRTGHDIKTCGAKPAFRKITRLFEVQDDLGLS